MYTLHYLAEGELLLSNCTLSFRLNYRLSFSLFPIFAVMIIQSTTLDYHDKRKYSLGLSS